MKSLGIFVLMALPMAQAANGFKPLSTTQRNLAYQITSAWENCDYNSKTQSWTLAYDYCEDIKDGQGITLGFTGFTTNGGDILNMLRRYNNINPKNAFKSHKGLFDCLRKVEGSDSVKCFGCKDGACHSSTLCKAAKHAYANDRARYIRAQTQEDGNDNWKNSQALAHKHNIRLPLTQAFLYDSCVNHACDYSGNDVERIIVKHALHGASTVGSSFKAQTAFFKAILKTRRQYMCSSSGCDCCSDASWRIPGFQWLADHGYWHLPNPMKIKPFQNGKSAPAYTFKCNPHQLPGCGGRVRFNNVTMQP